MDCVSSEEGDITMKKTIKATLVALTAILVFAGAASVTTQSVEAATKTTTSTSTKTSKKVTALKKAVKKSSTTTKTSTKTTTKKSKETNYDVVKATTVKATVKTNLAAKKKTVTTTVKTTVKTAKTEIKKATKKFGIDSVSGKADASVIKAFNTLGYKLTVNKNVSYAGYFNAKNRYVELKTEDTDDLLHELGHFVSFITGNKDNTSEFKSIYNSEASKYTGSNKAYVTKSSQEYFAESYANYCQNAAALKASRPQTYAYIQKCVNGISDNSVAMIKAIYY